MEGIRIAEDTRRLSLLVQILSVSEETRFLELKDMVYEYGSSLRESDILGRQVFVWMVTILNDVEMRQE